MDAGLTIYNDSNTVQIDQDYFNLIMIDKHSDTIALPITTAYNYSIAADVAVIAVKVWPETFTVTAASFSAGVWTFRLSFYNNPDTTGTCSFTIYTFGKAPVPTENFGLEVFNASGERIYHSQMKPLRIVAVQGGASGYTAPSGVDIATSVISMSIRGAVIPGVGIFNETNTLRCNGTAIQPIELTMGTGSVGYFSGGQYAAVDVTGY